MRGKIILAEHATVSGGNTISMLNAFINREGKGPKYAFRGMVVVQVVADMVDAGEHQFDILAMNQRHRRAWQ